MNRTRCWWLVLIALVCGGPAPRAAAQKSEDPPPYAEFKFDADPTVLAERLKNTGSLEKAVKHMLEDIRKNPDKYKGMLEQFNLTDPETKERLAKDPRVNDLIKNLGEDEKKAVKDAFDKHKLKPPVDPVPPDPNNPMPDPPQPIKEPVNKDPGVIKKFPERQPAQVEPQGEDTDRLAQWTQDVLKRLDKSALGDKLSNSAAWTKHVKTLEGLFNDKRFSDLQLGQDSLHKLNDRLKLSDNWQLKPDFKLSLLQQNGAGPGGLSRPDMNLPNPGGWFGPRQRSPNGGGFGGPVGTPGAPGLPDGAGSLGQVLLWCGVFAAIVCVVLLILRRSGFQFARRAHPLASPTGWPFQPHLIATRAELIAAFEYLSLLLLGREARTWNHKDIAAAVGDPARATPDGQRAADALAELYEQARYTPDDGPLTPDAVAAARRDLCLLAGVSNA